MKFAIVLFALFAVAMAAPPSQEAQIVRSESDVRPDGYDFAVETSDGTVKQEAGHLINAGTEQEAIVAKGSYQFVDTDGQTHSISYIADENGFQPQGADIPVAPLA